MIDKKLNQASRFVTNVDQFMFALYQAQLIVNEIASAGLSYSDADFEGTGLSHLTAANFTSALSNITSVVTALEANFQDDVFNVVRP